MKTATSARINSFQPLPIEYAEEEWLQSVRFAYLEARLNIEHPLSDEMDLPPDCQDGQYESVERPDGDYDWIYHAGPKDKAWMEEQDQAYLTRIRRKKRALFKQEMGPYDKQTDKGLNMKLKHHQHLYEAFSLGSKPDAGWIDKIMHWLKR